MQCNQSVSVMKLNKDSDQKMAVFDHLAQEYIRVHKLNKDNNTHTH